MSTARRLLFVLVIVLSLSAVAAYSAESYRYATTNMTWAEFYAGEIGEAASDLNVSYDAVSTATQRFATRFNAFSSTLSGDGTVFEGVKNVQVRMTENVYNSLADTSRFTLSSSSFDEYKEVDASGNFGAMVTETVDANAALPSMDVTITGGKSNGHGNYRINITGFSYDVVGATLGTSNDNFIGAKLETSDGTVYGLKPLHNLWIRGNMAEQIGFCVEDFSERNGTHLSYAHTASLPGKTITSITLMLKNQPDPVITCDLFVKRWTEAAVTPSSSVRPGANVPVSLTFSNIPSGASYRLASVAKVQGRTSTPMTEHTDYTVIEDYARSEDILVLTNAEPGSYTATFKDGSANPYVDITANITVTDYFATTNMTWAEYYAGEIGVSADNLAVSYDAVSTATTRFATRFGGFTSSVSNDNTTFTGVKAVQVRMTGDVYNSISDKSRYTFSNDVFTEYKVVSASEDFGAMVTQSVDANSLLPSMDVTITGGKSNGHGNYRINITGFSYDVVGATLGTSNDNFIGAKLETSDGTVYGLKPLHNLWIRGNMAEQIGFCVEDFSERNGTHLSYAHTASLPGKTITSITLMLKNQPDPVISCDLFVKRWTEASVSPEYESGYHAVTAGQNVRIPLRFSNIPTDAAYSLASVAKVEGRTSTPVTAYVYSGDVLTLTNAEPGNYTATFTDEAYVNIAATINVYTTDATSLIISPDNNAAGLTFLLTPKGVSDSTDAVLNAENFVNATDSADKTENFSAIYTEGTNQIEGSGISFDVVLHGIPSGKMGILGFSKNFTMTPASTDASRLASIRSALASMPDAGYGWRVPSSSDLRSMGVMAVGVYPNGISRDITGYISSGMFVSGDEVTMSYGTVLIDREFTPSEEGKTYALSEEGEGTMSDGAADNHIRAAWYVSLVSISGSNEPGTGSNDIPPSNNGNNNSTGGGSTDSGNSGSTGSDNTGNGESGGGSESTDTGSGGSKSTSTEAPSSVIMNSEPLKKGISDAIRQKNPNIPASVDVVALPTRTRASRNEASVSTTQLSQIRAKSQDIVAVLPVISVDVPAVYVFGVTLDMLSPDMPIFLNLLVSLIAGSEVRAAESEGTSEAYTFTDDSGNTTSTVPANQHVNVSAYMEPGYEYSPVITTSEASSGNISSSGGGCSSIVATVPMIIAALMMVKKRKA